MRPINAICLFAALGVCVVARAEIAWPEVPTPPRSKVEWIADNVKYNGLPMRVQRFESKVSIQELLAFYRAHWTQKDVLPVENKVKDWYVIGMPHGPFFMTVQVKEAAGGSTEGMIGVSSLEAKIAVPPIGNFPKIGTTRVLSVVESKDPGKSSRQLVLTNERSVSENRSFYESQLNYAGWSKIQGGLADGQKPSDSGYFAIFTKGKEQIDLAIARKSNGFGVHIMANLVSND
jgi:hypothetical protein